MAIQQELTGPNSTNGALWLTPCRISHGVVCLLYRNCSMSGDIMEEMRLLGNNLWILCILYACLTVLRGIIVWRVQWLQISIPLLIKKEQHKSDLLCCSASNSPLSLLDQFVKRLEFMLQKSRQRTYGWIKSKDRQILLRCYSHRHQPSLEDLKKLGLPRLLSQRDRT